MEKDDRTGTRRGQLRVVRGTDAVATIETMAATVDTESAVVSDGSAALASASEPAFWTRRAEPFARYDRSYPAVPRPDLPWAWISPRRLLLLLDVVAALVGLFVFLRLPDWIPYTGLLDEDGIRCAMSCIVLTQVVLVALMLLDRTYKTNDRLSRIDDGARLLKNIALAGAFAGGVTMLTGGFGYGVTTTVALETLSALLIFYALLAVNRLAMWWWQHRLFMAGEGLRRVVVLGVEKEAGAFRDYLRRRPWLGLELVGGIRILEREDDVARDDGGAPVGRVLGPLSELDTVLAMTDAHELVVALDDREREALPRLLRVLYRGKLPYRVMPQLFEGTYRLAPDAEIDGVPVFNVEFDPLRRVARWIKRGMDAAVAVAVLVLLSPVMLAAAIAIKVTSRGPVFFRQERVGLRGRPFTMLKFRTMCADAERRLVEVEHLNTCEGPLFKAADDPRVTRVGRFLRRWSIDELPQAINVLRGEMSLVGPRPPLPREVAVYETYDCLRLKGKPGITGLWQVSGRSEVGFPKMVELDRRYLEHWSLRLDFEIIWRTLGAVLHRRGAY